MADLRSGDTRRGERGADEGSTRQSTETPPTRAIFMLDSDGAIATWSAPARGLYGYESAEVLGRELTVLLSERETQDSLAEMLSGAADGLYEAAGSHRRADGSTFRAAFTLAALWDEHDGVRGYAVTSHDPTAERQHRRELERQNDRLKEYTDTLVHDLRTPISIIEARLDLYRETGERSHLDAVGDATDRMGALVDDLLRVARYGTETTEREPIDLGTVIGTAWEGTGARSPGATLRSEVEMTVNADAERLCQLLENLFRNAIEHGDTAVTVRVGPLETGFYVADDGPGIPEGLRETAFEHGVTTTADGTGYGLSIVRTIADLHGWEVTATGTETGGARFEITGIETAAHRKAND